MYSWAFPISFPFRKKRYICCVETISVILFYFILFVFFFFWKKDPRLLLSRRFCDRNNRLGDFIFKFWVSRSLISVELFDTVSGIY